MMPEYSYDVLMRMKKVELVAMADADEVDLSEYDPLTKDAITRAIMDNQEKLAFQASIGNAPGISGRVMPPNLDAVPAESIRIARIREQNK